MLIVKFSNNVLVQNKRFLSVSLVSFKLILAIDKINTSLNSWGKGRKRGTNDQENNFCHFSEDIFLKEMGGAHPLTC